MVLGDVEGVGCFVDDICIFTATWRQQVTVLREVFQKRKGAGLTVRPSKCMIGYDLVEFVGHKVRFDTLQPKTEKIQDVLEVPRAETHVEATKQKSNNGTGKG